MPAGTWTHLLTGRTVTGPRWVEETHGFHSLPLLVRPGTVLPWGAVDDRPSYDYASGLALRVYRPADATTVRCPVPAPDGTTAATFAVTRIGTEVTVSSPDAPAGWTAELISDETDLRLRTLGTE
ncbi:alpha-D-xyloside xylohydrolase [Actinacidiphila rubida]|uniref:Alpha-D-xyloside xylohydrolase n=1 Tax=Actinacidiphila rubida TaxID=310780 RepID=A0A1H8HU09_9ACTN|nr:alpha-D-xyloside xylohydrolase [Actinacidiphila rubida]